MNACATIITPDYLNYALALRESLMRFNPEIKFYILIAGKDEAMKERIENNYPGTVILFGEDLCVSGIGKKIYDKYFNEHKDKFRWSMKPVLTNHLILNLDFDKVLYLDCDLFFFNSFNFIFEQLDQASLLLTPHWRSMNPYNDPANFQILYNCGLYNGGFIGANKKSVEIMDWWAMACDYVCVKEPEKGYFNDQTHLNLFHIKFDNVEVIRHKGCNVANWNRIECERTSRKNGEVWINDEFPIVFIHFTASTVEGILNGDDILLRHHLEEYSSALKKYNPVFDLIAKHNLVIENSKKPNVNNGVISKFKRWIYEGR